MHIIRVQTGLGGGNDLSMKSERGAGAVETMVGLVLGVLMLTALVTVMLRAGQGIDRNNSKTVVFLGIETAAAFLGDDVAQALYTDLVDGAAAVTTMALQWTDYYGGTSTGHSSSYALSGGNLQRTYDGVVTTPAKNVTSVGFSRSGKLITVTFTTATTEGSTQFSEAKTYRFYMRPKAA